MTGYTARLPSITDILVESFPNLDLIKHLAAREKADAESNKQAISSVGIKLFNNEEVLEVQRQHKITLLMPVFLIGVFIFAAISLLTIFLNSQYIVNPNYFFIIVFSICAFLSFTQIFTLYTFLSWFYQFYIITDKRLISVHYFRVGGFHLDEVFHTKTNPLEIDRHPQNFLLDLLGIEDLYVYFQRFERPEPFIFKAPENHIKIGELLENHSLKKEDK